METAGASGTSSLWELLAGFQAVPRHLKQSHRGLSVCRD